MHDNDVLTTMPRGGVLSREALLAGIRREDRPLIRDLVSIEDQVQPNGIDLTLAGVARYTNRGKIAVSNSGRVLPELEELQPDGDGWFHLEPGPWHITYNEIVALPDDLMALGRPRSSLGRSGVTIHTAVWDAGYEGRSTSLLQVLNPAGFSIQRNARLMQLVFLTLDQATAEGYSGQYQGENIVGTAHVPGVGS